MLKVRFFGENLWVKGYFFCLLCSFSGIFPRFLQAHQPYCTFEAAERQAYCHLLNLQLSQARASIYRIPSENLLRLYLENWAEVLEVAANQDKVLYANYVQKKDQRLQSLKKHLAGSPYQLFLQAEITLQWALAQIVCGELWSAAWNVRHAFGLLEQNYQLFPSFEGTLKSLGVLKILLGVVPAQYKWLLSLWGVSGNLTEGFDMLQQAANGTSPFAWEARLWLFVLHVHLKETVPAISIDNHFVGKWIVAAAFRKAGNSSKALELLKDLPSDAPAWLCWEKATALMYSGSYQEALYWLDLFEKRHRGADLRKDARLKRFWCLWLLDQHAQAQSALESIATLGRLQTEADRHAAYFATLRPLPDKRLLQARLFTDGGYLEKSEQVLKSVNWHDLDAMNRSEFFYRLARNAHRGEQWQKAIFYYHQCLAQAKGASWYFLPNAALQLGYLYRDCQKDCQKARFYFQQALQYQHHPYKKSIERKAVLALAQLE